jgi:hypothetical protein
MNEAKTAKTFFSGFFDGFSMAGLFGFLRIPGDPPRLFAEPEHVTNPAVGKSVVFNFVIAQENLTPEEVARLQETLRQVVRKETHGKAELQSTL